VAHIFESRGYLQQKQVNF